MLEISKLVENIVRGNMLPIYEYIINVTTPKFLYYLHDVIYPHWKVVKSKISESINNNEINFSGAEEALREDVNREFVVLISQ